MKNINILQQTEEAVLKRVRGHESSKPFCNTLIKINNTFLVIYALESIALKLNGRYLA